MRPAPSTLPPLYDRWMRDCLQGTIPSEPNATCHDCAMCGVAGAESSRDAVFYDPRIKCCTFMPTLWNFLVGPLLEDESAEAAAGRRTVEARIDAGLAVTPFGLERPPVYQLKYARIGDGWGRSLSMRCPHYIEEGGLCGVWRARESTCATWFCKHQRGAIARRFWFRLHRLLATVEQAASRWAVLQLELGEDALEALLPFQATPDAPPLGAGDFDGRPDPAAYRRIWGRWAGRERQFYRAAGQAVGRLSWSEALQLGGAEAQLAVTLARRAYGRLRSNDLPARLRARPVQVLPDPDGAVVWTYSPIDPLRLSPALLEVLPWFDGRPTRSVLQAIRKERGLKLGPALLRRLVDFGLLEDARD